MLRIYVHDCTKNNVSHPAGDEVRVRQAGTGSAAMCENLPTVSDDDLQLTRRDDLGISCAEGLQEDPQNPSPDGCNLLKGDLTSVSVYHGASAVLSVPTLTHVESLEALQPLECFPQQALCPQEPGVYAILPQDPHGVPAAMTFQSSEVTHVQAVTSTGAIQGRVKERKKKCELDGGLPLNYFR